MHGPSEVVDPLAFRWTCTDWRGRPWEEMVIYEVHVGTFTPEGTFRAMIEKLPYLVDLGVTAVEIMPVADFPGGATGVTTAWRCSRPMRLRPARRPEGVRRCRPPARPDGDHGRRLQPLRARRELPARLRAGASSTTDAIRPGAPRSTSTPRRHGGARFFVENALYWVNEFAIDGLRFDAVHAIDDRSQPDILEEIAERCASAAHDRYVHLVLENDNNQARYLARADEGRPRHYVAQWNDDIHHACTCC